MTAQTCPKTGGLFSLTRTAFWSGKLNPDDLPGTMTYLINKVVIPVVDKKTEKEKRRRYNERNPGKPVPLRPEDIVDLRVGIMMTGDNLFIRFGEIPKDLEKYATAAKERSRIAYETTIEMLHSAHVCFTEHPAQALKIDMASLKREIIAGRESPIGTYQQKLRAQRERAANEVEFNPS